MGSLGRHFCRHHGNALAKASVLFFMTTSLLSFAKQQTPPPIMTWAAGNDGCGFSRGDDGKYRYSLKSGDLEIILAVDSREVQEIRRRPIPVLGVFATFRYRGKESVNVRLDKFTLQFLSHSKIVESALAPGVVAARLQKDSDALTDQTEHAVRKHPEKKQALEAALRTQLDELAKMTEFVNAHTLGSDGPALTPAEPESRGWIFFDTTNRWIGSWKKREEFLLRIGVKDRIFEFPFALPPAVGDHILRRRPQ